MSVLSIVVLDWGGRKEDVGALRGDALCAAEPILVVPPVCAVLPFSKVMTSSSNQWPSG